MNIKDFEDEYQKIWKVKTYIDIALIPPVNIMIKNLRVSSAFQIVRIMDRTKPLVYHYDLFINKEIFKLNPKLKILAAFRHELIHLWQLKNGKSRAHTKEFRRIAEQIKASIGHNLIMPKSKHKTFYYICPEGCQQFSTTEEPEILCSFCNSKMGKYNSTGYKKVKAEQKKKLQNFKQGKDDGINKS